MKTKKIFYAIVSIFAGLVTCYLIVKSDIMTAVLSCSVALIFMMLFITSLFETSNPFEKKLKSILKTYDSVLVEIECIPKISDKKVVNTKYFRDLVNVQFEVRKPIYYLKKALFCDFVVMTNDTAYVYTLKSDKSYKSDLEVILERNSSTKKEETDFKKMKEELEYEEPVVRDEETTESVEQNEGPRFIDPNMIDNPDIVDNNYYNQGYNDEQYYNQDYMNNDEQYYDDSYYQNDDINNPQNYVDENYYQTNDDDLYYEYNNQEENNVSNNQMDDFNDDDLDRRIEELKKELNKFDNN